MVVNACVRYLPGLKSWLPGASNRLTVTYMTLLVGICRSRAFPSVAVHRPSFNVNLLRHANIALHAHRLILGRRQPVVC